MIRVAAIVFGAYVTVTSTVLAVFGARSGNGWLAILYGTLGVTMGVSLILSPFLGRPLRDTLLGWALVGLALRGFVDGTIYLWWITIPIAIIFLVVLFLAVRGPLQQTAWAAAGAAASVTAFGLLALVAPNLPAICPGNGPGIFYPSNIFPWEAAEQRYMNECL